MALQFPSNTTDYLGTLRFTPVDKNGSSLGDVIDLYLPSSMQQGDKVEIENVGLGALLGTVVDMMDGTQTYDQFLEGVSAADVG